MNLSDTVRALIESSSFYVKQPLGLGQRAIERLEKRALHISETTRARTKDELAQVIRDFGDVPADLETIAGLTDGDAPTFITELAKEKRIVGINLPDVEVNPVRILPKDLWQEYAIAFYHRKKEKPKVLSIKVKNNEIATSSSKAAASKKLSVSALRAPRSPGSLKPGTLVDTARTSIA